MFIENKLGDLVVSVLRKSDMKFISVADAEYLKWKMQNNSESAQKTPAKKKKS